MKTSALSTSMHPIIADLPQTLNALLNHPSWDGFIGDRLGNDLFINDPDRAERCYDAAENGADGSTHAEAIQDQRDFAEILYDEARRAVWKLDGPEADEAEIELEDWQDTISALLDEVETWHETNGSLHQEIG